MANTDRFCDWFEFHQSFQAICGSIKEQIQKNNDLLKLEKIARQIIHIINTHGDRYLASKGVYDRVSTLIKSLGPKYKGRRGIFKLNQEKTH